MEINLVIGTDTLGDVNTTQDNDRYAEAVEAALSEEFPDAEVSVWIGEYSICETVGFGFDSERVAEKAQEIKSRIWDAANY